MSTKALLIKSYTNLSTGTAGEWNELNMAPSYIQGIKTGKILDEMSSDKLAALISGVPTPLGARTPLQVCPPNPQRPRSQHRLFGIAAVL